MTPCLPRRWPARLDEIPDDFWFGNDAATPKVIPDDSDLRGWAGRYPRSCRTGHET
ncbi:MAG: hypothetical protein R3E89_17060 [Thiolinea sp.]